MIATYARLASEAGATTSIVSSDKDLMQLVSDQVTLFDTMKDKRIGRDEVIEKFGVPPEKVIEVQALIGDSTDNVPGVPGIGVKTAAQLIGEYGDLETLLKRANEIKQDKRRQTLLDNAEAARMSKKLVTLDDQVALDVPIGDLAVHEPDYKRLIGFLKAMEFNGLMRRVAEFSSIDPGDIEAQSRLTSQSGASADAPPSPLAGEGGAARRAGPGEGPAESLSPSQPRAAPAGGGDMRLPLTGGGMSPRTPVSGDRSGNYTGTPQLLAAARTQGARSAKFDRSKYVAVRTVDALNAWIERGRETGLIAVDASTASADPMQAELCGLSLAIAPNEACYVPLAHRQGGDSEGGGLFRGDRVADQLAEGAALDALKALFTDPGVLVIGHDLKFAFQIFALRGIEIAAYDDVMLMSYALDAGRNSHALGPLAEHTFNHAAADINALIKAGKSKITFDAVGIDRATEYAAERADIVLRLWLALKPRLAVERVRTVYETLERPLLSVLARMERRGISIDRDVLSRLSGEFAQEAAGLEDEINREAGETVNPGSPKQLGDILFGKLGLSGGTKTKTGQWATGARALEELAEQGHELPQKILGWRQVSKLKSTYTDALPGFVNPTTHRVHTDYALASTTTGRLSSSDPNLQNIPVRTEDGRKIRRAFIAAPGTKLVSADYSQIELRLLAEIADIPVLKQAFRDGL
ncbi:MAG TPA: DNA polymerase, partial [Stellaceae bacterium]|nr:DNA polymerase [Stellaceae bacterium]